MKQHISPIERKLIRDALNSPVIEVSPLFGELRIQTDEFHVFIDGRSAFIKTFDEFGDYETDEFSLEQILK